MKVELTGHYGIWRLVRTGLPSIAMMIITSVYSVVDGFFVSNFAGTTAFASLNLVWPVIALLSALGLMTGTGGSALVSKLLGEGNGDKARSVFTMIVFLTFVAGVIFSILLLVLMKPLVLALGAEGEMVRLSVRYGRIVACGLPGLTLQMAFQSFYMTAERPQLGTVVSIVCGVINIVLDALFVAVFGWGLTGAAIATAIALAVGGAYPLIFFASKRNNSHLRFVKFSSIDWKSIAKTCTNGMSEYVGNIALSIVSIGYNFQLMKYVGENGVSAYGIIMYLAFILAAVFIGYNLCVSQVIAFNYGAQNRNELRSLLRKSIRIIAVGGLLLTVMAELSAPAIAKIFVGYDPELCDLTIRALRIYMLCFLICGFNMFCSAWFTALNNGIVSAVAAFARTLVFELASVFVLPAFLGIDGIWMAVNVAEVLAFILSAVLILCYRERYLGARSLK